MKKLTLLLAIVTIFFSCTESESNDESSEFENILKVEMDFFSTGATYWLDEKDGNPFQISGVEFNAEFTTIAGSTEYDASNDIFTTTFDNPEVLGKLIRGKMSVGFSDDFGLVGVYVDQSRQYESLIYGSVNEFYEIGLVGIQHKEIHTDDLTGEEVYTYRLSGDAVCNALTSPVFYERTYETISDGTQVVAEEDLRSLSCGERSYVEVRVYLPIGN